MFYIQTSKNNRGVQTVQNESVVEVEDWDEPIGYLDTGAITWSLVCSLIGTKIYKDSLSSVLDHIRMFSKKKKIQINSGLSASQVLSVFDALAKSNAIRHQAADI